MSLEGESGSNGGRLAGEKTLAADWTIGTLGRTLARTADDFGMDGG